MAHEVSIPERMPEGIGNAYRFQFFNGLCFSLILGAPALLFFKKMDASATILGVVAALPPLLNILQIPAARFVEAVGYKRFVLSGWFIRSFFILGVAGVALLPESVDPATRMVLALFLLFCFNTARGISVCGFLPWISLIIPPSLRARYFSLDQIWCNVAVLLTGIGAAFYLRYDDSLDSFAVLFFISYLGALVSLYFLKRIPDAPPPSDPSAHSRARVPWLRLFDHRPFRIQLIYNTVLMAAWAGGAVIILPMLRDQFGVSDSNFMFINAAVVLVHVFGCLWFGRVIEQMGSRPALLISWALQGIHFSGWLLIGARLLPFNLWTIAFQQLTWGLLSSLFTVSNMRLLMGNVPEMGRSHFFALHSVCTSLALGLTPVLWGLGLDALIALWGPAPEGFRNPYVLIYGGVVLVSLLAGVWLLRIHEPDALSAKDFARKAFAELPVRALPWIYRKRNTPGL